MHRRDFLKQAVSAVAASMTVVQFPVCMRLNV
ncbi:MAG: twin-arginine translocation signal domain-containing protein [Planctomycetes bacterium]|nr:twin-arginine translocation signal domain-containing protein [Planctomycetota bacterium]MCK5175592.1 twin-arginine translocation signal domain-containing protein [Planctomycetota bacterium]